VRMFFAGKGRAPCPAFLLLAAGAALSGCSILDPAGNRDNLLNRAANEGWRAEVTKSGRFDLFTQLRSLGPARSLVVYIEGDGRAFLTRDRASPDPTPLRPIGLRLALADPAPDILYLARPCQYSKLASKPPCNPRYWTTARLAPEVIAALSSAIDRTKKKLNAKFIELVGYSGGGAAAALVAARRPDVHRLVTVAANLDTDLWTRRLKVTAMKESLNPAEAARSIRHIPQMHLAGSDDDIVPASIGHSFLEAAKLPAGSHYRVIEGYSHTCCWHQGWRDRIGRIRAALQRTPGS